jgi:hypothetical protein
VINPQKEGLRKKLVNPSKRTLESDNYSMRKGSDVVLET